MTKIPMGMVLANKPRGLTSFQALYWYKKYFQTKHLGHTGTLDKFAEGLMLILLGNATRLNQFIVLANKRYRARFTFGAETDTLDPEGSVVRTSRLPSREDLEAIMPNFVGDLQQIPPQYSAIHMDGKRAYERVRDGEHLEMKARPITIHSLTMLHWDTSSAVFDISCSKGTYIRSLARDLANAAGSAAYVSELSRLEVGPYSVELAHSPDSGLEPQLASGVQLLEALPNCARYLVPCGDYKYLKNGRLFAPFDGRPRTEDQGFSSIALLGEDSLLLGMLHIHETGYSWACNFNENLP